MSFGSIIGKSFYEPLFGPSSLHLSLSYITLHWLRAIPGGSQKLDEFLLHNLCFHIINEIIDDLTFSNFFRSVILSQREITISKRKWAKCGPRSGGGIPSGRQEGSHCVSEAARRRVDRRWLWVVSDGLWPEQRTVRLQFHKSNTQVQKMSSAMYIDKWS